MKTTLGELMSAVQGLTTESEISEAVLKILAGLPSGKATFRHLIREIPNFVKLTPADHAVSETRPNEHVWEQRVRNISSHRKSEKNYIAAGYLVKVNGGLQITELGRQHAKKI
ncbi:hypothetical protein [Rhizobium aouanii]|uniref:Restriction system protein Mrr-like N-terminal domain-containing protein n=1 Tax=Rhizobium aouanii TaxID=3118145 RepID=A0ABU8CCR4_9HYPH